MQLSKTEIIAFQDEVWEFYRKAGRQMPWRENTSSYSVLVSEMMLQQTQVSRVIPKYTTFLYTCEDFASLARSPLATVLQLWSGLGYNRRAKYLHQTAKIVVRDFGGTLPSSHKELVSLPGVGKNTAGAILAYVYNQPVAFVETNIRTVYFHHFFQNSMDLVKDKEVEELVKQTLDTRSPREWYWALMDYGSHLKKTAGGRISTSAHYKKQPLLAGSIREMRGRILRELGAQTLTIEKLYEQVDGDERFTPALDALRREDMIEKSGTGFRLTGAPETS